MAAKRERMAAKRERMAAKFSLPLSPPPPFSLFTRLSTKGCDVFAADEQGRTALHTAAHGANVACVLKLRYDTDAHANRHTDIHTLRHTDTRMCFEAQV